jgi:phytoene dehydrogenase-like protein
VEVYQDFLTSLYPESKDDIDKIVVEIRKIMRYMEIQYGIDNPVFMDLRDTDYLLNTIMPWATRFFMTVPRINKIKGSANEYLKKFTNNQSLLDNISQHFFQETPAFFALSYLKIYLDYYYPRGGTARLIDALVDILQAHHGEVRTNTAIVQLDPVAKRLVD